MPFPVRIPPPRARMFPRGGCEARQESGSFPRTAGFSGDEVAEVGCSYAAALKRELDLYCAAVAKSMDAKSQESSLGYPNSQASVSSELISQASFHGDRDGASLCINSHIIDNADSQGMSANTGILKEQSGDGDDLEEITNPANVKKMRRMLSNRESARRSRRRKQIHLNDLESQVSSLTDENASLLKRLVDMTQKYKDSTFDNRNLIVDLEMMRRKVYIAEEAVRVTGASMLLPPTTSDMPVSSMPLTSSDAASLAVPVQENMHPFLQQPLIHGNQFKLDLPNATISLSSREMVTMAVSLRGVASMENLQKRIHKDSVHSGSALPLSDPEALNDDK